MTAQNLRIIQCRKEKSKKQLQLLQVTKGLKTICQNNPNPIQNSTYKQLFQTWSSTNISFLKSWQQKSNRADVADIVPIA